MADMPLTEPTSLTEFELDRDIDNLIASTMADKDRATLAPKDLERYITLLAQRARLMMPDTRRVTSLLSRSKFGGALE